MYFKLMKMVVHHVLQINENGSTIYFSKNSIPVTFQMSGLYIHEVKVQSNEFISFKKKN